jgi:hypothetical protein
MQRMMAGAREERIITITFPAEYGWATLRIVKI